MRRYLLPGLCVLALVLALHTMTLASGALGDLPLEQAEIVGADGTRHVFAVRLADTTETRARGLMYVTALEPDHGMLFDFGETRMVGMWMKNTPLSLDMLFITADGVIAKIARELGEMEKLAADELVEVDEDTIRVTPKGRFLLRPIAMPFDAYLAARLAEQRFSKVI
jgi:uncharacterized membrane protein (UPF0127 family)